MKRIILILVSIVVLNLTAEAQTKEFTKLMNDVEKYSMTGAKNDNYYTSVTQLPGEMIRQITKVDAKDKSLVENRIDKICHIKLKGRGHISFFTRAYDIAQKEPYLHYSSFQDKEGSQYRIYRYQAGRKADYIILIDNNQEQNYSVFYISGELKPEDIISLLNVEQYQSKELQLYTRGKVYNVSYEYFNHYPELNITIDSIEFTDEATIMHIDISFRPNYWIQFGSEYLLANGVKYRLQSVDKCALEEKYVMPASGKQNFVLTFPPINAKVTSLDWRGDTDDSWKILGIKIDKLAK